MYGDELSRENGSRRADRPIYAAFAAADCRFISSRLTFSMWVAIHQMLP
jgi:hypothetical protein